MKTQMVHRIVRTPTLLLLSGLMVGCAHQKTLDEKIYRVTSPTGTNYFRVRVESSAWNGKAHFKAGLYPAYAVDMYRGQESELPTELMDAETNLRKMVVAAQTNAVDKFLNATNREERERLAERLINVQEIVLSSGAGKVGTNMATALQFNPVKSLVDYTANKKFVIALSSDPDEILNSISAFVEEAKTTETVQEAIMSQVGGPKVAEAERQRAKNREALLQVVKEQIKEATTKRELTAEKLAELLNQLKTALESTK